MQATQRDLVVVCNHSPSSKHWTHVETKTVLQHCFQAAQKSHGADTPVPQATILCGDFNLAPDAIPALLHYAAGPQAMNEWRTVPDTGTTHGRHGGVSIVKRMCGRRRTIGHRTDTFR